MAVVAACLLVMFLGAGTVVSRGGTRGHDVREGKIRAEGPDLLVVLFDALRADHCSVYGYERATTPTLMER